MEFPKHIFREYDVRGIAGTDLTEDIVEQLGRSLAAYLKGKKKHNRFVVGRDGRLTSRGFSHALIDGLTGAGVDVIDIGEVPTGVTYYALFTQDVDGGVQITGSHNPKEYNGLKIAVGKSTIHGKEIQKLREIAEKGVFPPRRTPSRLRAWTSSRAIRRRSRGGSNSNASSPSSWTRATAWAARSRSRFSRSLAAK